MPSREIISLQLGHYANFVGAHVWNLQETCFSYMPNDTKILHEFNHDVFYREGKNYKGQMTYTPRLLVVDLRGSMGHLKEDGSLYDPPPSAKERISWSGKVTIHKTEPERKSLTSCSAKEQACASKADEDKDICRADLPKQTAGSECGASNQGFRLWSDFLRVDFHPRTVNLVRSYYHDSREDQFDLYGLGVQCWEENAWQERFTDQIRWFAEDCDSLQAFNITLDGYDGFAGLTAGMLEHLRDEYPNKASLCWPVFQPHYRTVKEGGGAIEAAHRHFNAVMCLGGLSRLSSAFCPLSVSSSYFEPRTRNFKFLELSDQSQYATSAVLGLSLDSMLCGLKLKSEPLQVAELLAQLTGVGRKLLSHSSSLPLGLAEKQLLTEWTSGCLVTPLTPGVTPNSPKGPDMSLAVLRGCPISYLSRLPQSALDPEETLRKFAAKSCGSGSNSTWLMQVKNPTRTGSTFPAIFSSDVSPSGLITKSPSHRHRGVDHLPSLTCLQSGGGTGVALREVLEGGSRLNLHRFHRCTVAGTEADTYQEALNTLHELASSYDHME